MGQIDSRFECRGPLIRRCSYGLLSASRPFDRPPGGARLRCSSSGDKVEGIEGDRKKKKKRTEWSSLRAHFVNDSLQCATSRMQEWRRVEAREGAAAVRLRSGIATERRDSFCAFSFAVCLKIAAAARAPDCDILRLPPVFVGGGWIHKGAHLGTMDAERGRRAGSGDEEPRL